MATFPSPTKTWHSSSYPSISPTNPSLSLSGKTVILTGGGSGIGLSIAKSVALAGTSNLIILGRRSSVLSSAAASITSQPNNKTNVIPIPTDIAKKADVDAAFAKISDLLPGIKPDILVTNAGYFTGIRPLGTESVEEWQSAFNVNVLGLYLITTAFIAAAKKDATIVHISAALAHLFLPGFSSYGVTKLAGVKLMQHVAGEYPELRVVNIHPGQITETDMAGKTGGEMGIENKHIDDAQLAGDFTIWVVSEEARFLKGKFVWANWDVDELKARAEKIESTSLLTFGLEGFPSF